LSPNSPRCFKGYNIRSVCGDRYAAQWCSSAFEKYGIRYEHTPLNRSESYLETLPILNATRVRLLDNARLISQLSNLERRTSRGGRDFVDHPPSGRDDVANAAAGVVATMRKEPAISCEPLWNFFERLNSDNYDRIIMIEMGTSWARRSGSFRTQARDCRRGCASASNHLPRGGWEEIDQR
jgi:hypothetical protein